MPFIKLSVFIPLLNEEEILQASISKVFEHLTKGSLKLASDEFEIIAVSNGSTDNTAEIANKFSSTNAWFRFFEIEERGPGLAFKEAVRNARGEYLITLDADLSSNLDFIDRALPLLGQADMLVGSKTLGQQRRSPIRVIGSQLYILFAQLCFNLTISDYSIGCKGFRTNLLKEYLDNLDTWTGYILELCIVFQLKGKKIVQISVACDDRRKSRFNIWHEGFYRYKHLYGTYRLLKDKYSWLYLNEK